MQGVHYDCIPMHFVHAHSVRALGMPPMQQWRPDPLEDITMLRNRNRAAVRISMALLALALTACAAPGPGAAGANPRSSAENQKKQGELVQMEAVGQRNDIDPPLK
jgi:hypothetical protein